MADAADPLVLGLLLAALVDSADLHFRMIRRRAWQRRLANEENDARSYRVPGRRYRIAGPAWWTHGSTTSRPYGISPNSLACCVAVGSGAPRCRRRAILISRRSSAGSGPRPPAQAGIG